MQKYFSNTDKSFYLEETVKTYEEQGIPVPSDLMTITDAEYEAFMVSPDRKAPQYNVESECMEWVDIEPPTREEAIENAEALKAQLLSVAAQSIAPLQDAVDLSMRKWRACRRGRNTGFYLTGLIPVSPTKLHGLNHR